MSHNEKTIRATGADLPTVDQAFEIDAVIAERFQRDAVPLMDQLFSGALRLTRNRHGAEDLVQETMLRVFIGFRSFRAGSNLNAWLYRILHNTWISGYRKQQRRPVEVAVDYITESQSARHAATAANGLRSAEVEVLEALPDLEIQAALLSLPEAFRMAIYYADVEGFSYAQIADIMGTPKGTVMSRLHRGRTQLRASLCALASRHGVPYHPTPQCRQSQARTRRPSTRKIPLNRGHVEQKVGEK
jgi:RNA polymerase sigma-70 factor, ECF subfamily